MECRYSYGSANDGVYLHVITLSLSDDGQFLRTDFRLVRTQSSLAQYPSQQKKCFIQYPWIDYQGTRMFWLPPEYRGASTSVHRDTVAFGLRSGRVALIAFDSKDCNLRTNSRL